MEASERRRNPDRPTQRPRPVSIATALAGKRIAITGATGFLGTALVERLLRCVPDCELALLVRPGRSGAQRRVEREIWRNAAFDRLREELGAKGFAECTANRVSVLECDIAADGLSATPETLADLASCDILIHSAASVAFDNPLDRAVETNLAGPLRLLDTLHAHNAAPHFIAISTAYVAGTRKGDAEEQLLSTTPFSVAVDWEAEIDSARRVRQRTEDESRTPERLAHFTREAAKKLGAAGTTALATQREQMRERWVEDTLIEAGRARAASLGFADAYTFTKALAEQALVDRRHNSRDTNQAASQEASPDTNGSSESNSIPLSIVRPSIIESSLAEPHPGWIRGFRMAEPIIINYAQGILKDFPALPESIIDVIPVDLVVAAVCAVAASPPPEEPKVFHAASGSVNPFRFQELHDWCHDWFMEHPVYDEHDQPVSPPKWSFPSRTRVAEQLSRAKRTLHITESTLRMLPVRGAAAEAYAEVQEQREKLERVSEYVDLYGMYVECDATYLTDRLMELWNELGEDDKAAFCFDPSAIDWHTYLTEIHLPSVMATARVKVAPSSKKDLGGRLSGGETAAGQTASGKAAKGQTANGKAAKRQTENKPAANRQAASKQGVSEHAASTAEELPDNSPLARWLPSTRRSEHAIMERRRQQILSPERHLAAFDLENTLLASNVVASWGWLATRRLPRSEQARIVARALAEAPRLLKLDRADRSDFLRYFYRRFKGAPTDQLDEDTWEMFSDMLLAQAFPDAIRRVRLHRDLGHRTVLITGALDFVVEPFHPLFDHIVCPSLGTRSERYTGRLTATPPIGENRAQALRDYARAEGLDLAECIAYADSTSDLPMLEVVGFPVAVNPEPKLASLARRRGWLVEHFTKAPGGPRKLIPIAPAGAAR